MSFIPPPGPVLVILISLVIGAAIFDVRYRRIPNWISVSGVAGFLLNAFWRATGVQHGWACVCA